MLPFPWEEVMHVGFGVLRLSPRDFWSMTARELAAALTVRSAPMEAPGARELAALMRAFPDDGPNQT